MKSYFLCNFFALSIIFFELVESKLNTDNRGDSGHCLLK